MRIALSAAVFVLLLSTAFGQSELTRKRGFLPPLFRLPAKDVQVQFTSPMPPQLVQPEYPAVHKQNDVEGAVELALYVTMEGDVVSAEVTVGSGDELFDDEALRSALKSRFPAGYATLNGTPTDFRITVPYYFLISADPEGYWHSRLELARVQQEYEIVMREFQNMQSARTVSTSDKAESVRKRLEEKVASAKRLHRMLAEKKEFAILRLRDEIASAKDRLDGVPDAVNVAHEDQRVALPDQAPIVHIAIQQGTVVSDTEPSANDLDRLSQELELKKSYL